MWLPYPVVVIYIYCGPAQLIPKAKRRPGFKSCYCLRDLCFEACLVEKSFASIFDGLWRKAQLVFFTNLQSHDTCKCRFHASAFRCSIATQMWHWWSNLYIAAQLFYSGFRRHNLKKDFVVSLAGGWFRMIWARPDSVYFGRWTTSEASRPLGRGRF